MPQAAPSADDPAIAQQVEQSFTTLQPGTFEAVAAAVAQYAC